MKPLFDVGITNFHTFILGSIQKMQITSHNNKCARLLFKISKLRRRLTPMQKVLKPVTSPWRKGKACCIVKSNLLFYIHNDCAPTLLSSFAESESQRCFNVTSHSERRKLPKIPEFCPSARRVSIML